jgi:transposase
MATHDPQTSAKVVLDLAKNVFQVNSIAAEGPVLIQRKLRRSEVIRFLGEWSPCLVGMEAYTSAHHWARELIAIGHK